MKDVSNNGIAPDVNNSDNNANEELLLNVTSYLNQIGLYTEDNLNAMMKKEGTGFYYDYDGTIPSAIETQNYADFDAIEYVACCLNILYEQGLLSDDTAQATFMAILHHKDLFNLRNTLDQSVNLFSAIEFTSVRQMVHAIMQHPDTRAISFSLVHLSLYLEPNFLLDADYLPIIEHIYEAIFFSQDPINTSEAICSLSEEGLLTEQYSPWNFSKIIAQYKNPHEAVKRLIEINNENLFTDLIKRIEIIVQHKNPLLFLDGIIKLKQATFSYQRDYYLDFLKKCDNPRMAAEALITAIRSGLTKTLTQSELIKLIINQEKPTLLIEAIIKVHKANALTGHGKYSKWSFITALSQHEDPIALADALSKLYQNKLMNSIHDFPGLVATHTEPMTITNAFIKLHQSGFFINVPHSTSVFTRQPSAASLAVSGVNTHKNPMVVVDALIALNNAGALNTSANSHYIQRIIQHENPQAITDIFLDTNTASSNRILLINQLLKYITRIESYSKYEQGFLLFSQSRAANRQANFLLASNLLTELIFSLDKPIREVFKKASDQRMKLINNLKIQNHNDKGIYSTELNAIIDKASEYSQTEEQVDIKPSLKL